MLRQDDEKRYERSSSGQLKGAVIDNSNRKTGKVDDKIIEPSELDLFLSMM